MPPSCRAAPSREVRKNRSCDSWKTRRPPPKPSPLGSAPPDASIREELPDWLVDGIYEMEDVMKGVYERGGGADLYEEQVPVKP